MKRIEITEELALAVMREADIGSGTTAAQLPEPRKSPHLYWRAVCLHSLDRTGGGVGDDASAETGDAPEKDDPLEK